MVFCCCRVRLLVAEVCWFVDAVAVVGLLLRLLVCCCSG